ncbi:UDP-glucose/GDP-mannose dehydrogenase family protein [Curvibacter sp. APW13]|uniref:UDP-glucose dehydrogenase family protein n=1 Tax=Curvibacter sp. APW13 TaxID=3077236 RepID=UPI0028DFEAE9|nr:UDP-glucose/GDP-mannose dehydrogenase family protein [Curvibacter sp. APW13]MDT8992599.1 UDP-glucose/GDP-mannose dehydrogenase family protein [Curvibacter sp. APW13]
MKVSVHGSGYVGLVTAACLADVGNDVLCMDSNASKIIALQEGNIPIYEPGLEEVIARNVKAGRLRFTTDVHFAANFGTVQFIAVGTPPGEDGSADMKYVIEVAKGIGASMTDYKIIVNKSTVPVGTADAVRSTVVNALSQRVQEIQFSVVSNPEFLKEGAAIDDFMRPGRIVIGSDDMNATTTMRALYAPFQRHHDRLIVMDVKSAELTKYAANAMLATRISFMNELANLAECVGADIEEVRKGIGSDSRIGFDFLYAGAGYGGSCFPKDVRALLHTASKFDGIHLKVLAAVEDANDHQKHVLGRKIKKRFGDDLTGRHFAIWGLAFKANTDDMRQATSLDVIDDLTIAGATVTAYDPVAMIEARRCYSDMETVQMANNAMDALKNADALVIVTDWKEFKSPDFEAIRTALKHPMIFDGRNLYDPKMVRSLDIEYVAIGR